MNKYFWFLVGCMVGPMFGYLAFRLKMKSDNRKIKAEYVRK